jgi:hypothetical protein
MNTRAEIEDALRIADGALHPRPAPDESWTGRPEKRVRRVPPERLGHRIASEYANSTTECTDERAKKPAGYLSIHSGHPADDAPSHAPTIPRTIV